jgi:Secretion system C-terminal sorting domain
MKKFLLLLIPFVMTAFLHSAQAQECSVSDVTTRITSFNPTTCEVVFEVSYIQNSRGVGPTAYLHFWTQAAYHTPTANWATMYTAPRRFPRAADLVNTLNTLVIEDNNTDSAFIGTVYNPDPAFTRVQSTGLTITETEVTNTTERITISGITLVLPSCTSPQTIFFDLWQSRNNGRVRCATQGLNFSTQLRVIGQVYCTNPSVFQVILQNTGVALNDVTYRVYIDYAPFGVLTLADTLVYTSDSIDIAMNGVYVSPLTGYTPYSLRSPANLQPLIAVVDVPTWNTDIITTLQNSCGPLPVTFLGFTATQTNNKIALYWQTASESNNYGFEVQRKEGNKDFKTVGFVASKAQGGNSSTTLSYTFDDLSNLTGAGQVFYRIKQVDIGGKVSYSEIRVIKNNAMANDVLVYPNPSSGTVNITLPAVRGQVNMSLRDMTGRTVQQWNAVTNNRLQLNNLNPGIYTLNVFIQETGEVLVKRIIIQ